MPLVHLRYAPDAVSSDALGAITVALKDLVAETLSTDDPGGGLTPNAIEVFGEQADVVDDTPFDLIVDIEAVDYPGRIATKGERADAIRAGVEQLLAPSAVRVGVWLKFVTAAWSETP